MWTALSAVFIVVLIGIVCSIIWIAVNVIGFIQPILIPVAIAVILAYLLEPLITLLTQHGFGRTKAILALFTIAILSIAVLVAWLAPIVSMQATTVGRELPQYTLKARDRLVDLIFRYDQAFGIQSAKREKASSTASGFVNWLLSSPARPCNLPTLRPVRRQRTRLASLLVRRPHTVSFPAALALVWVWVSE